MLARVDLRDSICQVGAADRPKCPMLGSESPMVSAAQVQDQAMFGRST